MTWGDVLKLTGEQNGLFTSAQALALGMTRSDINRRMRQGYTTQIRHGVYAMINAPADIHREVRAAWLALDPAKILLERLGELDGIVLCSTSAAEIYGAGIFYSECKEFYSPERKQTSDTNIRIRTRKLEAGDTHIVDGLPVVSPTILICDFLREGRDLDDIAEVVRDLAKAEYEMDWNKIFELLPRMSVRDGIPAREIAKVLMSPLLELSLPISPYQLHEEYLPPEFLVKLREVYEEVVQNAYERMLTVLE